MKTAVLLSALIFLVIASCKNPPSPNQQQQATPKALEDKSATDIVSKRGYEDMVESLYRELANSDPELKGFEATMDNLAESRNDSTGLFDSYNAKNGSYYAGADRHLNQIKDSAIRDKVKLLVASSLAAYDSAISRHTDLIKLMNSKSLTLNDLHEVLKIMRTLTVIEKYQHGHLPPTRPLEGYANRLEQALKQADTLARK